jgi:RHS repeat-associated protein
MLLPNRHGSIDTYRYGFQGQEKDDEIKGEGNSINYKFRMHDPRVGRFFAVDPLTASYPYYTPYIFAGNKVIQFIELEGLEEAENKLSIGEQIKAGYNAILGLFGDRDVVSQVKEKAVEIGDFDSLDKINKTQETADTKQLEIIYTYVETVGEIYGTSELSRLYSYHIEGNKSVYEDFNKYSALSEDTNLGSDTFWGTISAIPIVGKLKHLKKLKFLKHVKGVKKLKYSNVYGKCAEFCSEFISKYGDDIMDSGAKIVKHEVNIGKGGLIGTATKRLSDNGMHQFLEVIEDGKSIIYDNLHPEGIAKELYKIDGFINGKLIINLLEESKLITKELVKKTTD